MGSRMDRARSLCVLLAALLAAFSREAGAGDGAIELSIQDVLDRVDRFDPALREKSFERLRSEVELRKARLARAVGSVRLRASETAGNGSFLPSEPLLPGMGGWSDRFTGGLLAELSVPLYAGGAISARIEGAGLRQRSLEAEQRALARAQKRAALFAYGQLVLARRQVRVAEGALERAVQLVEIARRRRGTGVGTDADIARSRLTVLGQQEDLERRKGEQDLAMVAVGALLFLDGEGGGPAGGEIRPTQGLDDLAALRGRGDPTERPELLSLRLQVLGSESSLRISRAETLPHIDLFLSGGYGNDNSLSSPFLRDPGDYNAHLGVFAGSFLAGIRLEWKIFDLFVTRDEVAIREAERSILTARLEAERARLRRQEREADARLAEAKRRQAALAEGSEIAAQAIRLARTRYETGNAILTEVITAEIEANQIELRQIQADFDAAIAHVDHLLGAGEEP